MTTLRHITLPANRLFAVLGAIGVIGAAALVAASPAAAVDGPITGSVYEDFGDDGILSPATGEFGGDRPLAGVTVTARDASGATVGTTTTAADGSYALAVAGAATADIRVEITPPATYRPARIGPDNGSTVQFVSIGATGVDAGLTRPGLYLDSTAARFVVPTQRSPFSTTTWNSPAARFAGFDDLPSLMLYDYDVPSAGASTPVPGTVLATQGQTGTLWGEATLDDAFAFSGASMRRGSPVGPAGLGAIYLSDIAAAEGGTPNASVFTTIPGAGADPRAGTDPDTYDWLHDSGNDPANQNKVYAAVARSGLGDVELSTDKQTLYAVNLADKQLWATGIIDGATPTAGAQRAIALPLTTPGAAVVCPGEVVPHGLGSYLGTLYTTLTCTGPTDADVRVYVYAMDEATGAFSAAPVIEEALTYPRFTRAGLAQGTAPGLGSPFARWNETWQYSEATPLASTITFDAEGNALLSIKDRTADQHGSQLSSTDPSDTRFYPLPAAAELLRLCGAPGTGWQLENNGSCGGETGAWAGSGAGPGGGYFYDPVWRPRVNDTEHGMTMLGSALQLPGFTTSLASGFDVSEYFQDGFRVMDNNDGSIARTGVISTAGSDTGTFAKSGGVGDLTALIAAAPVEIGNRIWLDDDRDGQQDAGEAPIAGVTVRLYAADGSLVATTTTDAQGNYVFSSAPGSTPGHGVALAPDTDYTVRLDRPEDFAAGGPLANLFPTTSGAGGDSSVDSDGVAESPVSVAARVRTPAPGAADHTFDFGFVSPTLSLGNRIWFDDGAAPNDGSIGADEQGVDGVRLQLLDGAGNPVLDAQGAEIFATTADGGYYRFDGLAPGDYRVLVLPENFAPGGPLAGTVSSTGVSTDTDAASDTEDKGEDAAAPAVTGVRSAPISLAAGVVGEADTGPGAAANGPFGDAFDNLTVDLGFVHLFAVGNVVWLDADGDGLQDSDETPLAGVTVELLDAAGNPVVDAAGDPVASQTTGPDGTYLFDGLLPGDYRVRFSNVPAGYEFTQPTTGDTATDSNADEAGMTAPFTLRVGAADLRSATASDGSLVATMVNPTIDAGIRPLTAPAPTAAPTPTLPAPVPPSTLPRTGSDVSLALAGATLLLTALGAGVLGMRSRRRG